MFQEFQKKAKAVLKKVNHNNTDVSGDVSAIKRRSSDYVRKKYSPNILDDTNINYSRMDMFKSSVNIVQSKFDIIPTSDDSSNVYERKHSTPTTIHDHLNDYPLCSLNAFLRDDTFLKEHGTQLGGWSFLMVVVIFSQIILMSDIVFIQGLLSGIMLVNLLLLFYYLYTYSEAYHLHEYCSDLREYICYELQQHNSTSIDLAKIPSMGVVNKLQYTYKGWIYLTTDYNGNKLLCDLNPVVGFLSFGKQSLRIYIIEIICGDNKRQKNSNFNVIKQYRVHYSQLEFCIVPEDIPRKKYWSKKSPIKLTYSMGSLVSKRLDPYVPSYQKILSKIDDSNPCGPLPIPNPKYNNTNISLDYNGGDLYLFALTNREKERWYRSLKLCAGCGPATRSRTFRDVNDFSTVSVDPLSLKIDFISKVKHLISHYKSINLNDYQTFNNYKCSTKSNSLNPNINNNRLSPRECKKTTNINNKSYNNLQSFDDALMIKNVDDKSLPLSYNAVSSQSHLDIPNTTTNKDTHTTKKHNNVDDRQPNEKFYPIADDSLTLDYILSSKSLLALNLLAYRLTWNVWREQRWTEIVKVKIQTKIDSLKLPPFIKKLTIENLDLGDQLPALCSNCDPILDNEGGLWLNLPLIYNGKLSFTFNTQLDVSIYDHLILKASKNFDNEHIDTHQAQKIDDQQSDLVNIEILEKTTGALFDDEDDEDDVTIITNSSKSKYDKDRFQKYKNRSKLLHDLDNTIIPTATAGLSKKYLSNYDLTIDDDTNDYGRLKHIDSVEILNLSKDDLNMNSNISSQHKMDDLLNTKSGQKLYNVVEKLAQSPFVKKLGRTGIAKKMYRAAKNKLSNLNVVLTVNVTSVKGTLVLYVPPPPTDRLWFGFRTLPVTQLQISTKLNTKNIKLPILTQFINSKIKSELKDAIVLPNMEDIYIPIMSSDINYSQ